MAETATKSKPRRPSGKLYVWTHHERKYNGKPIYNGQVMPLADNPNDFKLIDLGYFQPVSDDQPVHQCLRCGSWFFTEQKLRQHQNDCEEVEVDVTAEVQNGDR